MKMLAISLPIALAVAHLAGPADSLRKGTAIMTRVGHPLCADRLDLQGYFRAALTGDDEATPLANGLCSLIKHQRHAVVMRTLPDLDLVWIKVSFGQRSAEGWTTTSGVEMQQPSVDGTVDAPHS